MFSTMVSYSDQGVIPLHPEPHILAYVFLSSVLLQSVDTIGTVFGDDSTVYMYLESKR